MVERNNMRKKVINYINTLKKMINNNARIILSSREKNMVFCENNNINSKDIKNILMNLNINNFCKILNNRGINSEEKLYLFAPIIKLKSNEDKQIYIKLNSIVTKNVIIVISFHSCKYKIKTYFNDVDGEKI